MNILTELKFAARHLAARPAFSIVAILTLAIGIGANITMFSATNAFLFRLIPAPDAERLFRLGAVRDDDEAEIFSYPWFQDLQRRTKAASAVAAYAMSSVNFSDNSARPSNAKNQLVSGSFFSIFGIHPLLGRFITESDNSAEGASPVAVLNYGFWKRQFASDPNVIGKKIFLNGYPFTIVGIMPEKFYGADLLEIPDLWTPLQMYRQVRPTGLDMSRRGWGWLHGIGKLRPGISLQQAQVEFDAITSQINREDPAHAMKFRLTPAHAVPETWVQGLSNPLRLLMLVVLILLVVVGANVAGVFLANVIASRQEIAIRKSLGASITQISMSWITRCAVLAFVGGGAGFVLAIWGRESLRLLVPPQWSPFVDALRSDISVIGFTFAICAITAVICGVIPIFKLNRIDASSVIKEEKVGSSSRLFGALIIGQVCLSFLLLILSGLFLRSLQKSASFQLGFRTDNLLVTDIDLRRNGYQEDKGRAFYRNLLERVRALDGVESAQLALVVPLSGNEENLEYLIDGFRNQRGTNDIAISNNVVTPGYFRQMQIPVLRGRDFGDEDNERAKQVVIVNEAMARRFWNTVDVVGRAIYEGGTRNRMEIVGVVADSKYYSLGETPMPYLYRPFAQRYSPWITLQVRTKSDPLKMIASVQVAAAQIDSNVALFNVTTFTELRKIQLFPLRALGGLCTFFGGLAVLLTMVGIYGVISYSVHQRFREIGIRMALGAHGYDVLRIFVSRAFRFTAIGIIAGLCLAFWLSRYIRGLLFHVSATDPFSFAAVAILIITAGMISCYLPARRALSTNVVEALRYE